MKVFVFVFVLALAGLSWGHPHRGWMSSVSECEEGTHAYALACGYLTPEPTCKQPHPETETGEMLCDYSSCYCDEPTVRDQITGFCVPLDKCPKY